MSEHDTDFENNVLTKRTLGNRLTEGSELLNLASLSIELGDFERATSNLCGGLDVAALTPDPGDDAFQQQRAAAIASLPDDRVKNLMAISAAMSLEEAVALARTELGS